MALAKDMVERDLDGNLGLEAACSSAVLIASNLDWIPLEALERESPLGRLFQWVNITAGKRTFVGSAYGLFQTIL